MFGVFSQASGLPMSILIVGVGPAEFDGENVQEWFVLQPQPPYG